MGRKVAEQENRDARWKRKITGTQGGRAKQQGHKVAEQAKTTGTQGSRAREQKLKVTKQKTGRKVAERDARHQSKTTGTQCN